MSFNTIVRDLENGNIGLLSGLPFEALLFLLDQHKGPVCVLTDRVFVEEAAVLFQERVGKDVACIVPREAGALAPIDKYYASSSVSIQMLATNRKEVSLCFVEASLFGSPLVPLEERGCFLLSSQTTFEALLSALKALSFSKPQGELFPGTFLVRGGVVDLVLFNSNRIYRVSFLEKHCKIFSVNGQNNKIAGALSSLAIYPRLKENKASLKQIFQDSAFCYKYKKNTLELFEKTGVAKAVSLGCAGVDYQCFITNKNAFPVVFLSVFFERGFQYEKTLYVPAWFKKQIKKESGEAIVFDVFGVLDVGGIYIHDDFGFCCFLGFETGEKQEKACLRFADGLVKLDVQYLSKLSFVSFNKNKKLSFLKKPGIWGRKKTLLEKQAEEFVGSLIAAYSNREGASSAPLDVSAVIIKDFVRAFPYQDTLDQQACWHDVLKDLGASAPMNRLVCGDVGFGKTEIALRAAFVSIINNQQVLILAPTTLLANQLYHCFLSRLSGFGVFVGCLSRITTNTKGVVSAFLSRKTDVLVGTSSLLFQKELLSQCGLFIVDEEHRFGVENKERVFQCNPGVNFLSLSATPIPRSMQLSLSKVRNFSLIQTPPMSRKPIISSLNYFSRALIKNILIKEVSRNGQVFFVDNSVGNLKKTFNWLVSSFPFLSFDIIYGSLSGKVLVRRMDAFVKGKTQILLSTTIIESGIDIGTTNTIIINNAHLFGLSQLYQLRGRVGRSSVQAFAWFLIPENKKITKEGLARLQTIIRYSSLGVGYKIALSDLEIRGAGSLFGYNQSGGAGVGFEYYSKMLALAVNKTRASLPKECFVDLLNGAIPASFLSDEKERALYYKKIFSAETVGDLDAIKQELVSVFGVCIQEVCILIQNRALALLGAQKNISRISKKNGVVSVSFSITKTDAAIDLIVKYIVSFFSKRRIKYWFLKSHKNLIFQYKSLEKDDYILLSSFINKITFF